MDKINYTPVHPGEILKDELEEIGLSQTMRARHIGVLPKTINEICRGKRGVSAEMSMKLSKALGGSPQFWLNLQNDRSGLPLSVANMVLLTKSGSPLAIMGA
ncbi:MAG: HigA family addiction module antidote protein [Deltaproteobacteria bacterium]|nr:HigA family addiction module antidote protein [Deltaproteobacteria bacterium]